jgi:hypothetical protein
MTKLNWWKQEIDDLLYYLLEKEEIGKEKDVQWVSEEAIEGVLQLMKDYKNQKKC